MMEMIEFMIYYHLYQKKTKYDENIEAQIPKGKISYKGSFKKKNNM